MKRWAAGIAAVAVAVVGVPRARAQSFWTDAPRTGVKGGHAALVERAHRAVVGVRGLVPERGAGPGRTPAVSIGTGFFIDRTGHMITNEHVVRGAIQLRARLYDGRELPACVLGYDEATDIALLRLDPARSVPFLLLGDSERVRAGDPAIVIGSPFGFNHSVTAGIVSARDRVLERSSARRETGEGYSFFIQTDASINLGNSGGPLLDGAGAVVGVSSAFWGSAQPAQGIGFAIPINVVKLLLPRLRDKGAAPRSFVGVESQPVDPALAEAFDLPHARGALIASVDPGGPAAAAGLEAGDLVVAWNGRPLAAFEDFKIYVQLTPPGTRVNLRILRQGQTLERTVLARAAAVTTVPEPHPSACGAVVAETLPLGLELAESGAIKQPPGPAVRGVLVKKAGGGAGHEAGLLTGDIILKIGRTPVRTPAELTAEVDKRPAGHAIPALCYREGAVFWVAIPH